jgi:CubicO group peptidase (beta-lactamase class C family)
VVKKKISLLLLIGAAACHNGEIEGEINVGPSGDSSGDSQSLNDSGAVDGRIWPGQEWAEASPESVGVDPTALEALRDYVFRPAHNTQALVVIKNGLVVGEWYVQGKHKDSLVTSWSMAKSVLSALVGVGLREGVLDLDDPVGDTVPAWSNGFNKGITIRHLLEMRSGLTANWVDPEGLYSVEADQLAYSLGRSLVRPSGQIFEYVNEDSMVLGEVVAQSFGEEFGDIAEREIFSKIGIEGVWWKDSAKHTLSYCCIDTTARDFARFGLLYARGGAWKDQTVVSDAFVKESTTGISNQGYYGLHWWTFGKIFAALGYDGQYLYVYPEKDLVVARFTNYRKVGNKSIRTGFNYHDTDDSGPLHGETLYWLVAGLVD